MSEQVPAREVMLGTRVQPYLINAFGRGVQFRDSGTTRVSDEIDRIFDSFTTDYLQAQSAYLASDLAGVDAARAAFQAATTQRVNLLSQQLTQSLVRLPGVLSKDKGMAAAPLQQFLTRRITHPRLPTSLLATLLNTSRNIPLSPGAPEAALYTLTATNAIESARVTTINASKFAISGVFRH
ncbi:hypothetical protein [Tautonia marina]|uniref:hypothetical protein n=1 Tax=Tautonia marina TaxID=2653855 RepID=UPI001260555E|nr:hypothetical protein [Tautonia marina]